ncbi:MAG: RES family NAD+ phosphorylase [Tabrizicola sp.]|nr:RES family NAD+ phosphorylase [Tabrizicola sp.]MCC6518717.1 RES family NAD+ phosphorylase [Tabrizicola sp.]
MTGPGFVPGIDGEGSRIWGGTWNSPGLPMVYLSSSLALSALEVLVNLAPHQRRRGELPTYVAVAVEVDDGAIADPGFPSRQEVAMSQAVGDAWLRSASSLGLSVPSRVIPLERNVLLNPRHPAMVEVRVAVSEPFVFDDRLGY